MRTLVGGQNDRVCVLSDGYSDGVSVQGSVTAATSTTLSDSGATFTAEMVGYDLIIVRGTGAGQVREVLSLGSSTQFVVSVWETTPDTTSRYALHYAIRGTVTSATANTMVDSSKTFSPSLAGAPVALLLGTGAGQVGRIITASSHTLTVADNWTTTPDATTTYLIGAIEATYKTGIREIPPFSPESKQSIQQSDERAITLTFKPTVEDQRVDVYYYPDHETTVETLLARVTDGPVIINADGKAAVKLQSTQSALGNAPGYARLPFRFRNAPRVQGRHWIAAELHFFQAEEEISVYEFGIEGMS
jgi:hypothetical protein